MKTLKDFFYNVNDIIIALAIVCLAGFLIFSRINILMTYNDTAQAGISGAAGESVPIEEITPEGEGETGSAVTYEETPAEGEAGDTMYPFALYIGYGDSSRHVGELLTSLGLFDSAQQFVDEAAAKGVDRKIQMGNFLIPQDASHDEVFEIITKPGL